MAVVKPFAGLLYNRDEVGDVQKVIAPPYDVISPEHQQGLYGRHPNNVVRLILGQDEPGDNEAHNKYTRAAELLEGWQRDRILVRSDRPAFYLYRQEHEAKGTKKCRSGFFCSVKLEDFETGTIHPHEQTMSGPKADRLLLMRACKANLSPIFSLYPDEANEVAGAMGPVCEAPPEIEAVDGHGVINKLWTVDDPAITSAVAQCMANRPLFIADGHHRYETALNYRQLIGAADDAPESYVMMGCVSMSDPGLVILATHRLLRLPDELSDATLRGVIAEHFDVDELPATASAGDLVQEIAERRECHALGLCIGSEGRLSLLTLRDASVLDAIAPEHSAAWRSLDVTILQSLLLTPLLEACEAAGGEGKVEYLQDETGVCESVRAGQHRAAVLLNPTSISDVRAVAANRETMPPKSTYFYPKMLSGLVMRPFA